MAKKEKAKKPDAPEADKAAVEGEEGAAVKKKMAGKTLILFIVLPAVLVLGGGGLLRNLIVGVIGSFVGGYVLNLAGIRLPIDNVWVSSIVTATIGALLVIAVARVVAK